MKVVYAIGDECFESKLARFDWGFELGPKKKLKFKVKSSNL